MNDFCPRPTNWQRHPAVRLRREGWGGIAFHRDLGDLLELDAEGFTVLANLAVACPLADLGKCLRRGELVRPSELLPFVRELARRGFIRRVSIAAPALPPDALEDPGPHVPPGELRAPLVAHWAVTYRCNLSCPFCYSESGPHREAGPDPDTRLRLVDRLSDWGVLEVALGGGEPTILPDFGSLLAAIRQAGMVPNVTTNGTVSHPTVVRALAVHAGVVHLSADRADLLDGGRGAGVFDRLKATARTLTDAGVRLGVNLLLTPDNFRDVRRSLDTVLGLGVQGVTFLRPKGSWAEAHWPGFPKAADLATLADDLKTFMQARPPVRLYVDTALRQEWEEMGLLLDPEPEVVGCGGGQRHVAVTPEGDVYPCSHARRPGLRMGNLLSDDLADLWVEGNARKAREAYRDLCAGKRCACRPTGPVES